VIPQSFHVSGRIMPPTCMQRATDGPGGATICITNALNSKRCGTSRKKWQRSTKALPPLVWSSYQHPSSGTSLLADLQHVDNRPTGKGSMATTTSPTLDIKLWWINTPNRPFKEMVREWGGGPQFWMFGITVCNACLHLPHPRKNEMTCRQHKGNGAAVGRYGNDN
jgi:hypothetical protein